MNLNDMPLLEFQRRTDVFLKIESRDLGEKFRTRT